MHRILKQSDDATRIGSQGNIHETYAVQATVGFTSEGYVS
jgi:hypothetical protein